MSFLNKNGVSLLWQKIKNKFYTAEETDTLVNNRMGDLNLSGAYDTTTKQFNVNLNDNTKKLSSVLFDEATASLPGFMSATDKNKLDGMPSDAFTGATSTVAGTKGYTPAPAAGQQNKMLFGNGTWDGMSITVTPSATKMNVVVKSTTKGEQLVTFDIPVATAAAGGLLSAEDKEKYDTCIAQLAGVYVFLGSVATEADLPATGNTVGDVYDIKAASSYGPAGANVAWNGNSWDSLGGIFSVESITDAELDAICV